jgi:hypothetical protein
MKVVYVKRVNRLPILVRSVVIDAELCREDHGLIPTTAIGRGLESLAARTDPRTRFN